MADFPGPQKNKVEYAVHMFFEEDGEERLPKQQILSKVKRAEFAPDIQVFFEELPERNYDEDALLDALNEVIASRGRTDAIGGRLEHRERFPSEWREAWEQTVKTQH